VLAFPERLDLKGDNVMNRDQISGNWKEMKGKAKERWGLLTDDDLDIVDGQLDQLVGQIQKAYGLEREKAKKEVDDFVKTWR
jgi:uncharacterized protein YjbJ (UPF0337 family)